MAAPPKEGASFSPAQTATMARAFELAVVLAKTVRPRSTAMSATEVRHRLACFIVQEAGRGPCDVERLARQALERMQVVADHRLLGARLIPGDLGSAR